MSDIICAVQGYVSPSQLGLSVQETLGQVYSLFQSNIILSNAGDPNGFVAGTTYQLCWDTTNSVLFVCVTSGTASTAVWLKCINPQSNWNSAGINFISMVPDQNYVTNNGSTIVTFTLPTIAAFGTTMEISGKSLGGWTITQNSGQFINFGRITTTTGNTGSISSSSQYDYIRIVCVEDSVGWNVIGSIGNLTIV
jgi:hypothetical protein